MGHEPDKEIKKPKIDKKEIERLRKDKQIKVDSKEIILK